MSRRTGIWLIAAAGVTAAIVVAVLALPSLRRTLGGGSLEIALAPSDADMVRRGREIYRAQCATCHGTDLRGQPDWRSRLPNGRLPAPPHDENGHTWHHPDKVLFELTKLGPAALVGGDYQSDMPAYKDILSDREIVAVLSYIKSRWPHRIRERHDQMNERAR